MQRSNQRLERTGGSHAYFLRAFRPPAAQPQVVSRTANSDAALT